MRSLVECNAVGCHSIAGDMRGAAARAPAQMTSGAVCRKPPILSVFTSIASPCHVNRQSLPVCQLHSQVPGHATHSLAFSLLIKKRERERATSTRLAVQAYPN